MLKIIAVALFFVIAEGEIFHRPCRSLEEYGGAVPNFDYPAYKGLWYQIERYDNTFISESDCNQASYTTSPSYTYNVEYISRNLGTGQILGISGVSRMSFPNESPLRGLLNATMVPNGPTDTMNYWILATDYTSYSFVVNCVNVNATSSSESYWLFGRSYPLPEEARVSADIIAARVLDTSRIRRITQGIEECVL